MIALQKISNYSPLSNQGGHKLPEEISKLVDNLFEQMFGANPNLRSRFPTEQALMTTKRQWILGFAENGVNSIDQLRTGMRNFRSNCQWFPSLSEFIAWCKSGEFESQGMPALEELIERIKAYSRFHGFDNQHEFQFKNNVEQYLIFDLYCRNKEFGWSAEELRKHAKAFLKATAEKLSRGEELPELALAIPERSSFIDPKKQQEINSQGVAMARAIILQGKANV